MSYSTISVNESDISIVDFPVTDFSKKAQYVVEKDPLNVTVNQVPSQNYSGSTITWHLRPSVTDIISKKLFIEIPLRLTFQYTQSGAATFSDEYAAGLTGLRAWPLQNALINQLNVEINSTSFTQNQNAFIEALLNYDNEVDDELLSTTPRRLDVGMSYSDTSASISNPMASFADSAIPGMIEGRNAFANLTIVSDDGSTAVVDCLIREPLLMSPFTHSKFEKSPGFFGVHGIKIITNFANGEMVKRVWSHNAVDSSLTITNLTVGVSGTTAYTGVPSVYYQTMTKRLTDGELPRAWNWPMYNITQYPQVVQGVLAPGGTTNMTTQSIQLESIPSKFYIFVKEQENDLRYTQTDRYMAIDSVSISFLNQQGLLSEAQPADLYRCCVENGLKNTSFSSFTKYKGSILCLELKDFGCIRENIAPSCNGQYQFRLQVSARNPSSDSINVTLNMLTVTEGILALTNGNFVQNFGVINPEAVLRDKSKFDRVSYGLYKETGDFYGGSKFSDFLKKSAKKAVKGIDKAFRNESVQNITKDMITSLPMGKTLYDLAKMGGPVAMKEMKRLLGAGMSCQDCMQSLTGAGLIGGGLVAGGLVGGMGMDQMIVNDIKKAQKGGRKVTKSKLAGRLR